MRNLKITKILLSLMLMFGLTTSSFAAGHSSKPSKPDNKPKIEKKVQVSAHKNVHKKEHHKKDVKVVKVYKEVKPHHKPHHKHHHDKVVYYSYNNGSDIALQCIGTGLCLAVLAAAIGS
ncbi:hypothetical protein [Candidatus Ruminimicrobiellum ovillum]|uniref:hypothetical protein n=1 Tax=Candidatus Ruminimicrobiellum ovillum TaxID=1947927 RepID=UPI00355A9247